MHKTIKIKKNKINIWLFGIAIIGLILKLPAFFQELPGLQFCDEALISEAAYQIYLNGNYALSHMPSGGLNYYFPSTIMKVIEVITGKTVSYVQFIKEIRILMLGLCGILPTFLIYATAKNLFKSEKAAIISACILTMSPYVLANSRIVYPDSSLVLFSSFFLFLISKYAVRSTNILAICLGFSLAAIASVKLSGLIYFIPLIGIFILNGDRINVNNIKIIHIFISIIVFILFFYYFNRLDLNQNSFLSGINGNYQHYKSGHIGLESENGFLWYTKVSLFTIFGVLGSIFILIGIYVAFNNKIYVYILLFLTAVIYIIYISQFKVVVFRNIMIIIPIIVLGMAYGMSYLDSKFNKMTVCLVIVLLLFEPIVRNGYSFFNDLRIDARIAAHNWMARNIEPSSKISVTANCWGNPIPGTFQNQAVIEYPIPKSIPKNLLPDYIVEDGWAKSEKGGGINPIKNKLFSTVHFTNPTQFVRNGNIDLDWWIKDYNYQLISTFSPDDYYGPRISIFKKME